MALESVGGRQTFFGSLPTKNKYGGKVATKGITKEARYTFAYDDLPGNDSGNAMVLAIPANSKIVSADMVVSTAWVGGTNLTVGLEQQDGTAIDADGLHAAILTAALTASSLHVGAGALIGVSSGAADAVVVVTTTGTFTAGDAELVVKYETYGDDAA